MADDNDWDMIIFPELSLTGYEPSTAKDLAIQKNDSRLDDFQQISNARNVLIGVGAPTKCQAGICISMIIFQPNQARQIYSKKYLHKDEEDFFVIGENHDLLTIKNKKLALAICYELSVPEHSENAVKNGAEIYLASVAKTKNGVEKASETLSEIARRYSMTVLMSNCVGPSEDGICAGNSAVWNSKGEEVGKLDDHREGLLIFDTETNKTSSLI